MQLFFSEKIHENHNGNVISLHRYHGNTNEIQMTTRQHAERHDFSKFLNQFSDTVSSMACRIFRHSSRNKASKEMKETEKIVQKIVFDDEKFRLLKSNLRNKGVATNGAIIEHLLQYDKSLGMSKLEADRNTYGVPKTYSIMISSEYQNFNATRGDKNSYQRKRM